MLLNSKKPLPSFIIFLRALVAVFVKCLGQLTDLVEVNFAHKAEQYKSSFSPPTNRAAIH